MRYTGTTPWPQRTGGFFYLNEARDNAPIISSSIRFRVTNSPDPFSFETGRDLELCGLPWTMPLIYTNLSLTMCMLEDGPFTGGTRHRMRRLSAIIEKNSYTQYSRWNDPYTPLIHYLSQPFHFDFSRSKIRFWLLKAAKDQKPMDALRQMWFPSPMIRLTLLEKSHLTSESISSTARYFPLYTGKCLPFNRLLHILDILSIGSAIVRFEKQGTGVDSRLSVRVLRIVEPVSPNGTSSFMDLPTIMEGSYIPIVHPLKRTIQNTQGPFNIYHPQDFLMSLPESDRPSHPDVVSESTVPS